MTEQIKRAFAAIGAIVPEIFLPRPDADWGKFAVIACDQHSAEPEYWAETEQIVGAAPSALRMIYPEAYLGKRAVFPQALHRQMAEYCANGTIVSQGECLMYVQRRTVHGIRHGLMLALDLEEYCCDAAGNGKIRATEETVVERLPARAAIRRGAPLELPHILVLVRDQTDALHRLLAAATAGTAPLYDFPLMQGGGQLTGYRIAEEPTLLAVAETLAAIEAENNDGFLYAMGDGNHSLAAAKLLWEERKAHLSPAERENDPARYALVELVNLYDPAIAFEPIHRVLLGVDPAAVAKALQFDPKNPPSLQLLQPRLDAYLAVHPEASLEYLHGADACRSVAAAPDRLGILFPPFDRDSVFRVVKEGGRFVRKSFSMGDAAEKRYYLEMRWIEPSRAR